MLDLHGGNIDCIFILYFIIGRKYVSVATRGKYYDQVLQRLKEEMGDEDFVKPVSLLSSVRLLRDEDFDPIRDLDCIDYVIGEL